MAVMTDDEQIDSMMYESEQGERMMSEHTRPRPNRITISISNSQLAKVQELARQLDRPVSWVVANMIESTDDSTIVFKGVARDRRA
jgi:hypothetical protein